LAWLGLAWLGLAWLGLAWLESHLLILSTEENQDAVLFKFFRGLFHVLFSKINFVVCIYVRYDLYTFRGSREKPVHIH